MKICPVGNELFCADGLIDMMKLIVTFHNFLNVSKNWQFAIDCNCNCNLFAFYKSRLGYNPVDIDIVTYILI